MTTTTKTPWHITGEEIGNCNCAWGCPCQFNALPTRGRCEGLAAIQIHEGHFGDTRLDGVRFVWAFSFPGAVHEGNGTRQMIIDEQATPEQRTALIALESGKMGGLVFEIYTSVATNRLEPIFAPITFESDREGRRATLHVPGLIETRTEPIKNPVTGEEHRARIVLPNGFEYKEAEMGNAASLRVQCGSALAYQYENTYSQLCAFDWSNA